MQILMFFIFCVGFGDTYAQSEVFQRPNSSVFERDLTSRMTTLNQWIMALNRDSFDLICFGETHNQYFRDLVNTRVLPFLDIDNLLLETQDERVETLLSNLTNGRLSEVTVTGAPIFSLLNTFRDHNPDGFIYGIEPSSRQTREATLMEIQAIQSGTSMEYSPSRDSFIATNASAFLERDVKKNFVIYGANHCTYFEDGLGNDTPFMRFLSDRYAGEKDLINVHVVQPHEEPLLKIYLNGFGLLDESQDLVLTDVRSIDPAHYNYRLQLFTDLQSYDVLYFPKAN